MKLLEHIDTSVLLDGSGYLAVSRNEHGIVTGCGSSLSAAIVNLEENIRFLRQEHVYEGPMDLRAQYADWLA